MTWVAAGMTAAEIAAAEAAAIAAAEIAATEAATAAATATATEAAATAAPGILEAAAPEILAPEVLTPGLTPPTGIEQIVPGAGTEVLPTASDQALQFANTGTTASDVGTYSQDRQILDMMNNFNANQSVTTAPPVGSEGIANIKPPTVGLDQSGQLAYQGTTPGGINVPPPPNAPTGPIQTPTYNPNISYSSQVQSPYNMTGLPQVDLAQGMPSTPTFETPQSDLGKGFNSALEWMDKNPFKTGLLGYTALNLAGAFDPESAEMPNKKYSGSLSSYRMSPSFQPSRVTPTVYQPRYAAEGGIMMAAGGSYDDEPRGDDQGFGFAAGGIASYARGRQVSRQEELQDYLSMMEGQQARPAPDPEYVGKTGIVYDLDPDTRYKDPLTASMIRMGKVNSKSSYNPYQNLKRPTTLGSINLTAPGVKKESASADDKEDYATGGITQADRYGMGGYASGSVPRLLKGPGDGMSDDIPASIDGRQPARLADGEFVIPADVVSGLGNGSTDAGAKHLHKMMTDVRKARTGNPKQGKQIQAEKFMPKKSRKA